ncbi:MAG: ABC-2 transporter permease [Clostridiales bacterium]|nr:ABC-2 transporter permease [Clostridiales bacterium]
MTGLLLKDWYLLKNQGRYFITIVILGLAMLFVGSGSYTFFVTSYLTFLFGIFGLSTISYDEFDNGMSYLMTLPVSRKTYVQEKFVFSFLLIISSWAVTVLVCGLWIGPKDLGDDLLLWGIGEAVYLVLVLIFVSVNLPLSMKFGPEKGKIIMFAGVGGIALSFVILARIPGVDLDTLVESVKRAVEVHAVPLLISALMTCLLFMAVCYHISVRIMEHREF